MMDKTAAIESQLTDVIRGKITDPLEVYAAIHRAENEATSIRSLIAAAICKSLERLGQNPLPIGDLGYVKHK